MWDDIADVITHAKFCDNRLRGFGVLIPQILSFSIGLDGRLYNSVSIAVLRCDTGEKKQRSSNCICKRNSEEKTEKQ